MHENTTYEAILGRMLERVPESLDKREGSVIYDALAPAAAEIQKMYIELDAIMDELFADTAGRGNLVRRAAERGLAPKAASCAVLEGHFTPPALDIPIGSRLSCGLLNYAVAAKVSPGVYEVVCESPGAGGNQTGALIPIDYIQGLETASLAAYLIPGEDEEDTEHFRVRYFASLDSQAFGGNIADYREKVTAIAGVGGVKVFPAWDGGGTVKLAIINSEYRKPSAALVQAVQAAIDPEPYRGQGYGVAPIGHVVTVVGAEEERVSVAATVTYQAGYSFERCKEDICAAVDGYFMELNKEWGPGSETVVRVSRLESRLLDLAGVLDVAGTRLNGVAGNYVLPKDALAVRGDVIG